MSRSLAALWENWRDPATGDNVRTFTVLTCEPNAMMATIHNRMPVILAPADYMTWLTDPDPERLMKPFPEELMTMWNIGRDIGNVRNNRPGLLDPVKDDLFDLLGLRVLQSRRNPLISNKRLFACFTGKSSEFIRNG